MTETAAPLRYFDGEELRENLRRGAGRPSKRVIYNGGEHGAVVSLPSGKWALTQSLFLEELHFDLAYTNPREVGHKAVAGALSALAALGAEPATLNLTLGLRQEQGEIFASEVVAGAAQLARKFGADLVGQGSVPSPTVTTVAVSATGRCPRLPFTDEKARVGHVVGLCGSLGSAAAGLTALKRAGRSEALLYKDLFQAQVVPMPRLAESALIAKHRGVGAVLDVRNGLTRELYRLGERSGVGVLVEEGALPVSPQLAQVVTRLSADPRAWVLYGAEDFALLFTVAEKEWASLERAFRRKRLRATAIGRVTARREGVRLRNVAGEVVPLVPRVWHPFALRGKTRWR